MQTRRLCMSSGFTLIEIMIVVAIIGVLLAVAVPNFLKLRERAQQDACIENLMQIETAKQLWALETLQTTGDLPVEADLVGPNLYLKEMPECPAGGTIQIEAIGTTANCTIPGHVFAQ